jgi:hypothetical protein
MFLMPAGAGGFLYSMGRKMLRSRSGHADPEQPETIEAAAYEPASGLGAMKTGAGFVKQPVASESSGQSD